MPTLLRNSIILLIIAGVAFGLGRYMTPEKVVTIEKESQAVDTTITTREVVQKDGTIIKEVIKNNIVVVSKEKTKLVESNKPNWKVAALSDIKTEKFAIQVERRIIGNVFIGGQYDLHHKEGKISVGMEF